MTGVQAITVSPSSVSTSRHTPCVLGCCGPMFSSISCDLRPSSDSCVAVLGVWPFSWSVAMNDLFYTVLLSLSKQLIYSVNLFMLFIVASGCFEFYLKHACATRNYRPTSGPLMRRCHRRDNDLD